jgi:hypothetical protein
VDTLKPKIIYLVAAGFSLRKESVNIQKKRTQAKACGYRKTKSKNFMPSP